MNPGHLRIDDEEGRTWFAAEQRKDRLVAVLRQDDVEALLTEDARHQLAAHRIVIRDQRGQPRRLMSLVHRKNAKAPERRTGAFAL